MGYLEDKKTLRTAYNADFDSLGTDSRPNQQTVWINELYPDNRPPQKLSDQPVTLGTQTSNTSTTDANNTGQTPGVVPQPATENNWLDAVEPVIDKVLPAVETILFVGGPWGIVASAGLGLLWALIRPEKKSDAKNVPNKQSLVHENITAACRKAVDASLKADHARTACNNLSDFQTNVAGKAWLFTNVQPGDFKSLETDVLVPLNNAVQPGGLLLTALDDLRDSLGWGDLSHEQALGLSIQCIFQAHVLRLNAYAGSARDNRAHGNWEKYNEDLGYIRDITSAIRGISGLLDTLDTKLTKMRDDRVAGVCKESRPQTETVTYVGFKDPAIDRFWPSGAIDTSGGGGHAEIDDDFDMNLYKGKLNTHIPHTMPLLRSYMYDIRDQLSIFLGAHGFAPSAPSIGPIPQPSPVDFKSHGPIKENIIYALRFKLFDKDDTDAKTPLTTPSPWSPWVTQGPPNMRTQFLIGDGYALDETLREIWITEKPANSGEHDPPAADAKESKFGRVGPLHGIVLWPDTPSQEV